MTTRRTFIKNTSLTIAAISVANTSLFANPLKGEITGLQLYSVRDAMKKDPLGTLEKLAKQGYKYVEHANYVDRKFYGYEPKEFKKILKDLGMSMPSGHTVFQDSHWDAGSKDFTDAWKYTVEDAAFMGQDYVISPWLADNLRQDKDTLLGFMEIYNKNGELCKASGMKFGYHNHDFEFTTKVGDEILYDIILKNTDPDLVIQQLDIGNMENGGAKALDWMKKYPGRFQSLHVKDEIESSGEHGKYESTILGTGIVDVKGVLDLARKNYEGTHFIIEVEAYQGKDPMDVVESCLAQMNKWGY